MATATTYIEALGRRKSAVARVRITKASKEQIVVNERPAEEYFPTKMLQHVLFSPLRTPELSEKFSVTVKVHGGGISAQSQAARHGLARALVEFQPELRKALKKEGFLKRDPRAIERKKFGLKKARKRAQWSKR